MITAQIGGVEGGGALTWNIEYDDQTRDVTTTATGTGFCLVSVQLTNTVTRTIAYYPSQGATSANAELAAQMAAADFQIVADGDTETLATGINPNAVRRIVGKASSTLGGLISTVTWSRA